MLQSICDRFSNFIFTNCCGYDLILENTETAEKEETPLVEECDKESIVILGSDNKEVSRIFYSHFYRIEDVQQNTRGYLMGTVHMIHKDLFPLRQEILSALEQADRLFLEIPFSKENSNKKFKLLEDVVRTRLNNHLKGAIDDETANNLSLNEITVDQYKVSLNTLINTALATYKNILKEEIDINEQLTDLSPVESIIACYKRYIKMVEEQLNPPGSDCEEPVLDCWLHQHFLQAGKPISALETEQAHQKAADSLILPSIPLYTLGYLTPNIELAVSKTSLLIKQLVSEPLTLEKNEKGSLEYSIFEERSIEMGKKMVEDLTAHPEGIGFYACGAAHLYDCKNVIKQLTKGNFSVIKM